MSERLTTLYNKPIKNKEKVGCLFPAEHYWLVDILEQLKKDGVGPDLVVYVGRFLVELKKANYTMKENAIDALIMRVHLDGAYEVETQFNHLWKTPDSKKLELKDDCFIKQSPNKTEEGEVEMTTRAPGTEQFDNQVKFSTELWNFKQQIIKIRENGYPEGEGSKVHRSGNNR